jgi:hypothetical protein
MSNTVGDTMADIEGPLSMGGCHVILLKIRIITKLPNSEQSYKGKVKTHKYIKRQNQSTTENCEIVITLVG